MRRSLVLTLSFALLASACRAAAAVEPSPTPIPAATETLTATPPPTPSPTPTPTPLSMEQLVAGCKSEGQINLIATPRDWANYGEIFDLFVSTSGVHINSVNEGAGSQAELNAIEANKSHAGPDAPDIVDIGYAYGAVGMSAGDLMAYKVTGWSRIPDTILGLPAKDPEGYWTGGYYGVMAFAVDTSRVKHVPADWADLLKPEYRRQVALAGDPRTSNLAIQAIYAAALANGGSLDNARPGLDFFQKLNLAGNFMPLIAKATSIQNGSTPIGLMWDYLALTYRDAFAGKPALEVVYPSRTLASMYVQAISAYAPHPYCAKLWMEVLHSDAGQLAWMKGYVHGVDEADMQARGAIPEDVTKRLPGLGNAAAVLPTSAQLSAARDVITSGWDQTVGVDVK